MTHTSFSFPILLNYIHHNDLQDVAPYLDDIVMPVLACFSDQDNRVRYYACESMYNIAKVAKGEILRYFNEVFDAMSKVSSIMLFNLEN
jgi:hypothetical protein